MRQIQKLPLAIMAAFMGILMLASCQFEADDVRLKREIKENEERLAKDRMHIDTALAIKVLDQYLNFVRDYPMDSLSAEFLFKASDIARGVGRFEQSIRLLEQIPQAYPAYPKVPLCMFMQGFIYQNNLDSYGLATQKYTEFIDRFPTHPLASDARNLMSMMTMTEEELMGKLKRGEKLNSAQPF